MIQISGSAADDLQHPRRNLGNRFRSQAEKFVKLVRKDPTRKEQNLAWAEQNAQQALLHDFTDERNWLTLIHIKKLRGDADGIHRCLEDLFTVLGRDPERVDDLAELNFLELGHDLMSATLLEDPLNPDKWWQKTQEKQNLQAFADRCKRLDFRDQRANITHGRRMQKLREDGQVELFIDLVQHLLAHRPANFELWLQLGRLHEGRKEVDEAWLCYDHVQALRPRSEERDKYLKRLTERMDSAIGWKGPDADAKTSFLKRMEKLARKISTPTPDAKSEEDVVEVESEESKLQALLSAGDAEEAFFMARGLLAIGESWASEYMDKAREMLN